MSLSLRLSTTVLLTRLKSLLFFQSTLSKVIQFKAACMHSLILQRFRRSQDGSDFEIQILFGLPRHGMHSLILYKRGKIALGSNHVFYLVRNGVTCII